MSRRYSKSFKRDIRFYLSNRHRFSFFGGLLPLVVYDPAGVDGVRCFFEIDSSGKYLATKHVRLVRALLACKKSINWHLRMWAEGYDDVREGVEFYLSEFKNPPGWVGSAFRGLRDR